MIKISPKVIKDLKTKLKSLNEGWEGLNTAAVCNFSCFSVDGENLGYSGKACHASLQRAFVSITKNRSYTWSETDYSSSFILVNCHKKANSNASPEAVEAVILWLAKDSPYSKYFLNRDDEESLKEDGALILCGKDGASCAEAMWLCKVLRYHTEGSKALDVWYTLYQAGVNPFLAVLVSTWVSSVKGATFGKSPVKSHVTVFDNYSHPSRVEIVDIKRLLAGEGKRDAGTTQTFFAPKSKKSGLSIFEITNKIDELTTPEVRDDGWGGKITKKGATKSQFIENVLAWQKELTGQISPPSAPDRDSVYLEVDL